MSTNYAAVPSSQKVPYPVGGGLSLDVAGPLIPAKDIGGLYARWMLAGTLTWAVPAESEKMKDPEVPKAEGNESYFEVYPEDEQEKDEDNAKEGQEEAAGEEKDGEDPMEVWAEEDEVKEGGEEKKEDALVPGGAPPEPPYLLPPPEKKEGEEELKPGGFDIKIFRLAAPMITKTAREVTKTAMDFILKLRMDGFHIGRIHSDRGHEFSEWHSADTHTWR